MPYDWWNHWEADQIVNWWITIASSCQSRTLRHVATSKTPLMLSCCQPAKSLKRNTFWSRQMQSWMQCDNVLISWFWVSIWKDKIIHDVWDIAMEEGWILAVLHAKNPGREKESHHSNNFINLDRFSPIIYVTVIDYIRLLYLEHPMSSKHIKSKYHKTHASWNLCCVSR